MSNPPHCPECHSTYTYEDRDLYVCPECTHEWHDKIQDTEIENTITDANGNTLTDGDTVSVIKDLKVKGSSSVLKVGTKVKRIRLVEGDLDIHLSLKEEDSHYWTAMPGRKPSTTHSAEALIHTMPYFTIAGGA